MEISGDISLNTVGVSLAQSLGWYYYKPNIAFRWALLNPPREQSSR